jgi:hypothetical protein
MEVVNLCCRKLKTRKDNELWDLLTFSRDWNSFEYYDALGHPVPFGAKLMINPPFTDVTRWRLRAFDLYANNWNDVLFMCPRISLS